MSNVCDHKYVFQHVVYWYADTPLPGSGAHARVYGDKYYCERCLETEIINERTIGNSYQHALPNTFPK